MSKKRTTLFDNGLVWFGAAVSIAEIITGTSLAPLGFSKGLFAIIIGHIIGCLLLFAAGVIGGKARRSAMETVKMSFGGRGSLLFVLLNVIQLIGWTAIMIYDGAVAANGIFSIGIPFWSIVIGGLIILWICVGLTNLGKLNTVAMSALFILSIILSFIIFRSGSPLSISGEAMSFGAAVELSIAMPLSWLPLISDYTSEAEKPVSATAVSAITYGIISSWMYIIGLGAALFAGDSDIANILIKAGLGIAGLLIIVFSTTTTTFLDAYSAGISSKSAFPSINANWVAIGTAVIGILGAIFLPLYDITDFLYFIGSVFAPMIAIQITDFFILKRDVSEKSFCIKNIIIWLIGFILYRILMNFDIILGSTIPDMAITIILCIVTEKARELIKK